MQCPKCHSENTYQDGNLWICPECSHEWMPSPVPSENIQESPTVVKDASGNILVDGDAVIIIKDLQIKGTSQKIKGGTKVRNIRLIEETDGHNFCGKVEGIGLINLKSEFVRKA